MQFGRKKIKTDVEYVDESNVLTVLESAMNDHISNYGDIEYLYNYFKGRQPVLQRKRKFGLKSAIKSLRTSRMRSFHSRRAICSASRSSM